MVEQTAWLHKAAVTSGSVFGRHFGSPYRAIARFAIRVRRARTDRRAERIDDSLIADYAAAVVDERIAWQHLADAVLTPAEREQAHVDWTTAADRAKQLALQWQQATGRSFVPLRVVA